MSEINPFDDIYIKDYKYSYDKSKRIMVIELDDIDETQAKIMKRNLKLMLGFYVCKFLYRFVYHNKKFKLIISLCNPEVAKDFEKLIEFTKV